MGGTQSLVVDRGGTVDRRTGVTKVVTPAVVVSVSINREEGTPESFGTVKSTPTSILARTSGVFDPFLPSKPGLGTPKQTTY